MAAKRRPPPKPALPPRYYRGAGVPMRVIRRFARQVAERFHPEKVILFGSHAYGTPHADSDVDILVVMPARNAHEQAGRIRREVPTPFEMDLIVRTPKNMQRRLADGDLFHTKVVRRGKVLYPSRFRWTHQPDAPARDAPRRHMKRATREWADTAERHFRLARQQARSGDSGNDHI
jgi:predicted nucleotidyltransferase